MDVSGKIADEVKRLEGYRNIQDSCLAFIELRKTITQNNTNIAGYAKTAPIIVKAYNTYMKGVTSLGLLNWAETKTFVKS